MDIQQNGAAFEANDSNAVSGVSKGKRNKRALVFILVGCALLIAAVVVALGVIQENRTRDEALRQSIINSGTFHDGIIIEGIQLNGKTMEQATELLRAVENDIFSQIDFQLTHVDGGNYPVTAEDLGITFNTVDVLNEAMQIAREGTLEELQAILEELKLSPKTFSIDYQPDPSTVATFIADLAEQLDTPPVDAHFKSLIDQSAVSAAEKKSEKYVIAAASTTSEQRMSFVPDETGYTLDQPQMSAALVKMAQSKAYADMELAFHITQANVTLEDLQQNLVLRASFSTSFAKSPYNRATRVFNIQKAVGLINGKVLQPGEVFSTNDTLGHRTYDSGWKPAPAIVQGRTEDQAGGGVCQVSSTLYNCVVKADLEIVYRQGHSGRLSYVPGGLDATIDSGRIDFKWKNNTASPLYLFGWTDTQNKTLHFEIYGEPFPDEFDEIELSSKNMQSLSPPGEMQYVVDYTKPTGYKEVYVGRKSGSIWQSYITYKKDGAVVNTVPLDKTTYRAYAGETIIGPPAAVEPELPEPTSKIY